MEQYVEENPRITLKQITEKLRRDHEIAVSKECSRGSNIHAIGCIGNLGLIHHEIRRGSFKKPELKEFIRQCLQNAQNFYESAVVPMLNPIELAWSDVKSGVKADLAIQMPHIRANENRANITQTEYRLQSLENIIQENINKLTVVKCTKYIAHIQRCVPDVLNMVDISF
ncbi:hypothetical protein CBL_13904 [Carabus blaptoides fortunei]